jgi:hypothetical protein
MDNNLRFGHLRNCWVLLRNNDGLLFAHVQNITSLFVLQNVFDEPDPVSQISQRVRDTKSSRKL